MASKIFPVLPLAPVVLQRARGSVRRLGIDALDLYQLHQPNPVVPLSSTGTAVFLAAVLSGSLPGLSPPAQARPLASTIRRMVPAIPAIVCILALGFVTKYYPGKEVPHAAAY